MHLSPGIRKQVFQGNPKQRTLPMTQKRILALTVFGTNRARQRDISETILENKIIHALFSADKDSPVARLQNPSCLGLVCTILKKNPLVSTTLSYLTPCGLSADSG